MENSGDVDTCSRQSANVKRKITVIKTEEVDPREGGREEGT